MDFVSDVRCETKKIRSTSSTGEWRPGSVSCFSLSLERSGGGHGESGLGELDLLSELGGQGAEVGLEHMDHSQSRGGAARVIDPAQVELGKWYQVHAAAPQRALALPTSARA